MGFGFCYICIQRIFFVKITLENCYGMLLELMLLFCALFTFMSMRRSCGILSKWLGVDFPFGTCLCTGKNMVLLFYPNTNAPKRSVEDVFIDGSLMGTDKKYVWLEGDMKSGY